MDKEWAELEDDLIRTYWEHDKYLRRFKEKTDTDWQLGGGQFYSDDERPLHKETG